MGVSSGHKDEKRVPRNKVSKPESPWLIDFTEGIRERDKPHMFSILKTISYMRDNTYHLNRNMWNDVHEDWPFYTEQDKAILKR